MRMKQPGGGKRRRLAAFRTRSRHPCALINCSRQLMVLKAANRLRFPSLSCVILHAVMTASGWDRVPAGRHPAPLGEEDKQSLRVLRMGLVIGVSGRDRLAVFRTTGCREQPISAHGRLERVLQSASRSLPLARPQSPTRHSPTRRVHEGLNAWCKQHC